MEPQKERCPYNKDPNKGTPNFGNPQVGFQRFKAGSRQSCILGLSVEECLG